MEAQPSPGRSLAVVLLASGVAMAVAQCGRVSFIGDGQYGDAGPEASSSSSSSTGGISSSRPSSSSSQGGTTGCGGLGPQPTFQVTAADVTNGGFAGAWTATAGSNCNTCHGPSGFRPFNPAMPDPSANVAGAANSLTTYCQAADGTPLHQLVMPTDLVKTRLVCPLVPNNPPVAGCSHVGGTPANTESLGTVGGLPNACSFALQRYQQEYSVWLDGGYAPDAAGCAGTSSSSGGGNGSTSGFVPTCPRPEIADEFHNVFNQIAGNCNTCHGPSAIYPCFAWTDETTAHQKFCDYALSPGGQLVQGGFLGSRYYTATHGNDARYACTMPFSHASFVVSVDPGLLTWYDAIFRP